MPRASGPKTRSRTGCNTCKKRKVKCGEERPKCQKCQDGNLECDYNLHLTWLVGPKRGRAQEEQPDPNSFLSFQHSKALDNSSTIPDSQLDFPSHASIRETNPVHFRFQPFQPLKPPDKHSTIHSAPQTYQACPYVYPLSQQLNSDGGLTALFSPELSYASSPTSRPSSSTTQDLSQVRESTQIDLGISSPGLSCSSAPTTRRSSSANQHFPPAMEFSQRDITSSNRCLRANNTKSNQPKCRHKSTSNSEALNYKVQTPGDDCLTTSSHTDIPKDAQTKRRRTTSLNSEAFGYNSPTPAVNNGEPSTLYSEDLRDLAGQHHGSSSPVLRDPRYSGRPATATIASAPLSASCGMGLAQASSKIVSTYPKDYGYDIGSPDKDVPDNADHNALPHSSSIAKSRFQDLKRESTQSDHEERDHLFGFGEGPKGTDLVRSNYYSSPLRVKIPIYLEPLPQILTSNPMNILYFNHFLNHTARVLVPHDCQENAFRTVLPQMAVEDENLMKILLAYSAHHRAVLLKYPEPRFRISLWTGDVSSSLHHTVDDNSCPVSNSSLAAAIMLSSLGIISPNALEGPDGSWHSQLSKARSMINKRGGYHKIRHGDKSSYFLSRWFAYLDILGSLSGGNYDRPLTDNKRDCNEAEDFDNEEEIDCFLGCTGRCIAILAEVANLAKDCEDKARFINATTGLKWCPSEEQKTRAHYLKSFLMNFKPTTYRGCSHRLVKCDTADAAVNQSFHHAGLIHLYRRVLQYPSESLEVQNAVEAIECALNCVEDRCLSCMIFPVFAAGCEAQNGPSRKVFVDCLKKIERMGMAAARRSREVMQKVWKTGKPWQSLVILDDKDLFVG